LPSARPATLLLGPPDGAQGTGRETTFRPVVFGSSLSKRVLAEPRPRDAHEMESLDDYWNDSPADPLDAAAQPKTPAARSAAEPRSSKGLPTDVVAKARGYAAAAEESSVRKPPGGLLLARTPVSKAAPPSGAFSGASGSGSRRSAASRSPAASAAAEPALVAAPEPMPAKMGGYLLARTPVAGVASSDDASPARVSPIAGAANVASLLEEAAVEAAADAAAADVAADAAEDEHADAAMDEAGVEAEEEQSEPATERAAPTSAPRSHADGCTQFPTPGAPLVGAEREAANVDATSPALAPDFGGAADVEDGGAAAADDDDDDDGNSEFGAGLLDEPAGADEGADEGEDEGEDEGATDPMDPMQVSSDDDDEDDEEEEEAARAEPPTPTLTTDGSTRPPARMSVDDAEAARAKKDRAAQRKRRRGADASCIHPSLSELEAREAAREAAARGAGGADEAATRHSSRRKIPVLDFWRNERVVYGRRQSVRAPSRLALLGPLGSSPLGSRLFLALHCDATYR
jgi:hypothetical protein